MYRMYGMTELECSNCNWYKDIQWIVMFLVLEVEAIDVSVCCKVFDIVDKIFMLNHKEIIKYGE